MFSQRAHAVTPRSPNNLRPPLAIASLGYITVFAAVSFAWAAFLYSVIRSQ
jgi:hypothetical protein